MNKLFDRIYRFTLFVSIVLLCAQVAVISYMVFMRYVFNNAPNWSDTLALLFLVWFSLLGVVIGIKENAHIRMMVLDYFLSKRWQHWTDQFSYIVILCISLLLVYHGYIQTSASWPAVSSTLGLSRGWWYLAVPVSSFIIVLAVLEKWGGKTDEH